eukprot:TRINITY_DN7806_c0_g1_i1.p1 TRINITY_DN7806_c0_g1~~TRINITY_DN7806_c0_g1_i1.p1  ORF type:complete len:214 (+),score=59.12 TRINITY_DN7806_c0_g1_i1:33-674(+)
MGAKDSKVSESDVLQLQESTNFDKVELKQIIKDFKRFSVNDVLTKENFKKMMIALQEFGLRDMRQDPFIDDLFDLFDEDKSGTIDLKEFSSGVSLLCKGKPEEKVELTFNLWDENKDGVIDKQEMNKFFTSCYTNALRILMCNKKKPKSFIDIYAPQLGKSLGEQISSQIFVQVDKNNDGSISKEEFLEAFKMGVNITCQFEGQTFKQVIGFY